MTWAERILEAASKMAEPKVICSPSMVGAVSDFLLGVDGDIELPIEGTDMVKGTDVFVIDLGAFAVTSLPRFSE